MAASPIISDRPGRWDASFDPEMPESEVDRVLTLAPFSEMDESKFPKRISLRDILQHDTRIRKFRRGEIVVRNGDYGTSAFMIMSGSVRVALTDLPASVLGRKVSHKKGFFRQFAQLWSNSNEPETRQVSEFRQDSRIAARQDKNSEVKVFLQDIPRLLNEHKTATIDAGEFFGEIAALSRMPRTATVFADTDDTELLEIRWQGLRDLMRYDSKLREHINKIYRERALSSHLRDIPIFQRLNDEQLKKVMDQTIFGTYGDYDWSGDYKRLAQSGAASQNEPVISQEGDYPNGMILIRAGFARLSQKFGHGNRTLNYLGGGQSYGFQEIAHNWRKKDEEPIPLQYTLRVIGYTHILIIPTAVLESVVLPTVPESQLPPLIEAARDEEEFQPDIDASAKIGPDMLEFLAENRFFNGTATMVIDLDRCTRCDDCVRACASTHNNNPRFLRNGPINGKIMIANACMHCADPVCMIGCPTGAIHRDAFGGQVVINQSTCIGCNTCANNCPYEAIRMVEIRDEDGEIMIDKEMKPIVKATKCDLCVEQTGGPSCQRACPHGALKRMNLNDIDSFAEWLKR
ncbi:MAG: cyclic nucleotide-binding domain-containing protein [Verrucomicrobiota bacterium]